MGIACVTVYVLLKLASRVFAYALGDKSLKSWGWVVGTVTGSTGLALQCTDCPFWNTQTNHFIPEALQTLTSRGGGGGAVPLLAWPPAIRTLGKNSPLLFIQ